MLSVYTSISLCRKYGDFFIRHVSHDLGLKARAHFVMEESLISLFHLEKVRIHQAQDIKGFSADSSTSCIYCLLPE